ncbi:MAG: hypothetical protein ACI9DC_000083 [Gammaproteobacteria bacterium]|jgi:hypothetical protein
MLKVLVLFVAVMSFNAVLAKDCPLLPDEAMTDSLPTAKDNEASSVTHRLQGETYSVTYRFEPASPAIGEHFNLLGRVCRNDGAKFGGTVKADATMPDHGHGMNYVPTSQMFDNGQFVASGLLLHMPGHWALELRVAQGANSERLRFEYQAKR